MIPPKTKTIASIIEQHRNALGFDSLEHLLVSPIGSGEANLNLRLIVNDAHEFNFRIGLRGDVSARCLHNEERMQKWLPTGIGSRVLVVDSTTSLLAQPYSILDYLPGTPKTEWSDAHLNAHANTLAKLHERKFPRQTGPDSSRDDEDTFLRRFDAALDNFGRCTGASALPIEVARLVPPIRSWLRSEDRGLDKLNNLSIVHGDLHRLNILFNEGNVHYVDWERATFGDPAQDLAMIGWDIPTAWQMELKGNRLDNYLHAYCTDSSEQALRRRRELWMVHTMFFDQLYHRGQRLNASSEKHAYTVQQISTYLLDRFG